MPSPDVVFGYTSAGASMTFRDVVRYSMYQVGFSVEYWKNKNINSARFDELENIS